MSRTRTSLFVLMSAISLLLSPLAPIAPSAADPVAEKPATSQVQPESAKPKVKRKKKLKIISISNRPDLISGGDALIGLRPYPNFRKRKPVITLNGRNVSGRFRLHRTVGYQGLLTGLREGRNLLRAKVQIKQTRYQGSLVITNHNSGGPVFSGPHTRHYRCQATAVDALCNEPATYSFLYKSSNPLQADLQPYDVENPPTDVATTTTDQGRTVPFIVRREDGYQDRDRYTILALADPTKPFQRGQKQWNRKVLIPGGGGCGASHGPSNPPLADYAGTISDVPAVTPSYVTALGMGYSVISTALANTGHNCNVAMNAESLMMAKERFIEHYARIRFTVGTGCSGGSIVQHTVANAYPGIYQGLITTCSYPDTFTAGAQFADYHMLRLYFEDPSRWAPGVVWLPTQMADVEGHITHLNAVVADEGLFKAALNPEHDCGGTVDPVPGDESTRYDSETNPGGVRCSVLDLLANQLGVRPESVWSEQEQAAGRGFGGVPFSNEGVVYGLRQFQQGTITPAQFVDLNVKVGGLDVDSQPTVERIPGDPASIANAYRTGHINEANNLDGIPMINFGGPDPGIAHDYAHAFWMEDRLQRDQGHTKNRVMWFGVVPLIGDPTWANEALGDMDRWLTNIERDRSGERLPDKVADNRPANLTDRCFNVPGILGIPGEDGTVDCLLPDELQLRLSTPREQAGGNRFNDNVACQLKPLTREDFAGALLPLSDTQFETLQGVFPDGICDYSVLGRGQQPTQAWLTYFDAERGVKYGGRLLPSFAQRHANGWSSDNFRPLLRRRGAG